MCDQQWLRPAYAYAQSDHSLCQSLECSMTVKLLTEHNLEFVSLKGGCTGSCQNATLLEITCRGSNMKRMIDFILLAHGIHIGLAFRPCSIVGE